MKLAVIGAGYVGQGVARMVLDRSGVDAAGLEYFSLARQPEMALSR